MDTFKALGAEYNRKIKEKPLKNILKMLTSLITYLEYAEECGALNQWTFLVLLVKKVQDTDQGFNFKR